MLTPKRPRLIRPKALRPFRGCSAAYSWLRQHHGDVTRLRQTWPWAVLIEEMCADGVVGRNGARLTEKAVSRVWFRVCRDVASEQAAVGGAPAQRSSNRSAAPGTRPIVVSATAVPPAVAPASRSQTVSVAPAADVPAPGGAGLQGGTDGAGEEHADTELARIRALLREQDDKLRF